MRAYSSTSTSGRSTSAEHSERRNEAREQAAIRPSHMEKVRRPWSVAVLIQDEVEMEAVADVVLRE
eukprot:156743-Prymnesium_polylepis.2